MRQRRRLDATGLHLDPRPTRERLLEQRREPRLGERLTPGDHQQRRFAERQGAGPDFFELHPLAAAFVPRVLGIAPMAADVTTLEADEVGGRAGAGALSLQGKEDLADAQRGHRRLL